MKWFRYYTEALYDPKVQGLPPKLFKHWVNLLSIAAMIDRSGSGPYGVLPPHRSVGFALRIPEREAERLTYQLIEAGFIDVMPDGTLEPHHWHKWQPKSDNAAERMANKRRTKTEQVHARERERKRLEKDGDVEKEAEEMAPLLALLVQLHEDTIGMVSPTSADILQEWSTRIPENANGLAAAKYGFTQAALSNRPNLNYVIAVWKRLESEQWPPDPGSESEPEPTNGHKPVSLLAKYSNAELRRMVENGTSIERRNAESELVARLGGQE